MDEVEEEVVVVEEGSGVRNPYRMAREGDRIRVVAKVINGLETRYVGYVVCG